METNLTKNMKRGLRYFKPSLPTKMRTVRFAEEVWTPTGIVDVIKFEDYVARDLSFCALLEFDNMPKQDQQMMLRMSDGRIRECKIAGATYPNSSCKGCVWHRHSHEIGMLITCYECKITVADFKSKNGHNFHGNRNYYVVPKEIVQQILPLVPEGIGLIQYDGKNDRYRTVKECAFRDVDESLKTRLLYDALKKWVDKFGLQY